MAGRMFAVCANCMRFRIFLKRPRFCDGACEVEYAILRDDDTDGVGDMASVQGTVARLRAVLQSAGVTREEFELGLRRFMERQTPWSAVVDVDTVTGDDPPANDRKFRFCVRVKPP